jgi:hypothetical protein
MDKVVEEEFIECERATALTQQEEEEEDNQGDQQERQMSQVHPPAPYEPSEIPNTRRLSVGRFSFSCTSRDLTPRLLHPKRSTLNPKP